MDICVYLTPPPPPPTACPRYSVHRQCVPPAEWVVVADPLCPQHAAFALIAALRTAPADLRTLVVWTVGTWER